MSKFTAVSSFHRLFCFTHYVSSFDRPSCLSACPTANLTPSDPTSITSNVSSSDLSPQATSESTNCWGGVKGIKTGNKVRISGESMNKQAIIYTSALVNEARIRKAAKERMDAKGCSMMFSDDDMK